MIRVIAAICCFVIAVIAFRISYGAIGLWGIYAHGEVVTLLIALTPAAIGCLLIFVAWKMIREAVKLQ